MNAYDFSKMGRTAEKITLTNDRYLLTEEHLSGATNKLKTAVETMEAVDLEKVDISSIYSLAAKVSTAATRIKKIQLHEELIKNMSKFLVDNMKYDSWYERVYIKSFLSSNWQKSPYYQSHRTYTEPLHHIDVLLNRLVINGTLKSITVGGITYYSLSKEDF